MAVNNSITQSRALPDKPVEYQCGGETVKLSPNIIRNFLVRGNGDVTDQEIAMFLNLCRFQHLNPFLNEAYLIKYGNTDATIVVGKEAIAKRAMRNKKYRGQQAGIVIYHEDKDVLEYRTGSIIRSGEKLVGGWAKVYVSDYEVPIEVAVSFEEYVGLKDGKPNKQWARKPATMIRKVALTQALREAFPEDLGGLYDAAEMGVEFDETAAAAPVDTLPQNEVPAALPEEAPANYHTMDELPGDF